MIHHPCILGGPQQRGTKSEVAASPLPFGGPKRGQKCDVTPAFSGVPNKGLQNRKWLPQPCLLRGPKERRNETSPLNSQGSPTKGNKIRRGCLTPAFLGAQKRAEMRRHHCILQIPQKRGTKSKRAASPLPSSGAKSGHKCYITPHSGGSPTKGNTIRSGCLTRAFSGAQKRAEMLCHPSSLGGPQQRGTKSEVAASPLPSQGPKKGRKCYVTRAFSGVPEKEEQNQKGLPHPCLLGGPKVGRNATSPRILGGPQQRGTQLQVVASPLPSRGPKRGRKC